MRQMVIMRLPLLFAALLLPGATAAAPVAPLPDFVSAAVPVPDCAIDGSTAATAPLDLAALLDLALCRDPATRAAWAGVKAAAAREAQVRAAYGPRLDAGVGTEALLTRRWGGGFPADTSSSAGASASLSLNWLLFDFGGREARFSQADAARSVAFAQFAERVQAILLEAGVAYFDLLAAIAAEVAARENLRFAENSLAAATARERAGVGIKSDRLQADAAAAQALLALRQADGNLAIARGRLATAVRLPPTTRLGVAAPAPPGTAAMLRQSADMLIDEAIRLRPDLAQGRANLRFAEAGLGVAEAARRPSLSLAARPGVTLGTQGQDLATGTAGVTLSIPLFDSGGRTAAVIEARAEAERAAANLDATEQGAALDVWSRYQTLTVQSANLDTARRVLASSEEAAALAQGRYRSGLATIVELLNAQAVLADARRQLVAAEFGVRTAELQLARAVGRMGDTVP